MCSTSIRIIVVMLYKGRVSAKFLLLRQMSPQLNMPFPLKDIPIISLISFLNDYFSNRRQSHECVLYRERSSLPIQMAFLLLYSSIFPSYDGKGDLTYHAYIATTWSRIIRKGFFYHQSRPSIYYFSILKRQHRCSRSSS